MDLEVLDEDDGDRGVGGCACHVRRWYNAEPALSMVQFGSEYQKVFSLWTVGLWLWLAVLTAGVVHKKSGFNI